MPRESKHDNTAITPRGLSKMLKDEAPTEQSFLRNSVKMKPGEKDGYTLVKEYVSPRAASFGRATLMKLGAEFAAEKNGPAGNHFQKEICALRAIAAVFSNPHPGTLPDELRGFLSELATDVDLWMTGGGSKLVKDQLVLKSIGSYDVAKDPAFDTKASVSNKEEANLITRDKLAEWTFLKRILQSVANDKFVPDKFLPNAPDKYFQLDSKGGRVSENGKQVLSDYGKKSAEPLLREFERAKLAVDSFVAEVIRPGPPIKMLD